MYEPLFSYGHLRTHFQHPGITDSALHILNFVRPERVCIVRTAVLEDANIFSHTPNTVLQGQLSPISRQFLWELHSGIMLRVLENITDISNLLPDTHCHHSYLSIPGTAPLDHNTEMHFTNRQALIVAIDLDTGGATLSTPDKEPKPAPNSTIIRASYWQHPTDQKNRKAYE